jgi:large conductance mechanosensitive channel
LFKGFKEFVLRGNVIDLAVAVVVGAAFTALVNSLVTNIFDPLIGALFNAKSLATLLPLKIPTTSGGVATLQFGAVIAAIIQFLLVAVVVYFAVVMPINYLSKIAFSRRATEKAEEDKKPAPPTELELLAQIRDLLASGPASEAAVGASSSGSGRHAGEPTGVIQVIPPKTQ